MSHWEHNRNQIWSPVQHILKHTLDDFTYVNAAAPGVTSISGAFDWIFKVLYPNVKPAVATPAALPASGNTIHDYRVVLDDGDGKQAGYRWEQREGDIAPLWYKVFDFDWSTDAILAAFQDITQPLYVFQQGKSDLDNSGNVITGTLAGQTVYGGNQANQNLTLKANSGDGTGPSTGFVQVGDDFRPITNNTLALGTSGLRFSQLFLGTSALINTMTISTGSITDSSGTISFGSTNLTTTGNITGTQLKAGTLTISDGSIVDTDGSISFGSTNLTTLGTITANVNSVLGTITFASGSIVSSTGSISFGSNNLTTTGNITGAILFSTSAQIGNINISVNTITTSNTNGNLIISANGTGVIDVQKAMTTLDITTSGVVSITGQFNADNLRIDGNIISSTNTNGNVRIFPNGTGDVEVSARIHPSTDNTTTLGLTTNRWTKLFLSSAISDGTTEITQSTLQSLRDINVGVSAGMSLFWDGSKWSPSVPDTEITHNTLSGLTTGDAGHTQFALLAGRSGGQSLVGGTAAAESLTLESTSNASKGTVQTKDNFVPFTNASFSGGWQGKDLGDSTHYFRDLYSKGELKNARIENFTFAGLPSTSSQNVGRVAYATDTKKAYVDTGSQWKVVGVSKYINDETFDGSQTTKTVTVSADITDARQAIWALHDNVNNFDRIYCSIQAISATQVQITTHGALPAGSYRLIGIE